MYLSRCGFIRPQYLCLRCRAWRARISLRCFPLRGSTFVARQPGALDRLWATNFNIAALLMPHCSFSVERQSSTIRFQRIINFLKLVTLSSFCPNFIDFAQEFNQFLAHHVAFVADCSRKFGLSHFAHPFTKSPELLCPQHQIYISYLLNTFLCLVKAY